MYDWMRTAPTKYYESYSYNNANEGGFGVRSLPPKPTGLANFSKLNGTTNDKALYVNGRNMSNSSSRITQKAAAPPDNRSQSHSRAGFNKSITKLEDDVYPRPRPVPKQRSINNNLILTNDDINESFQQSYGRTRRDKLQILSQHVNLNAKMHKKTNEEQVEFVDDEYDNINFDFKYTDQQLMDETCLNNQSNQDDGINYENLSYNNDVTVFDKENLFYNGKIFKIILQVNKKFIIHMNATYFYVKHLSRQTY